MTLLKDPSFALIHHSATVDTTTFSWSAIRMYHTSYAYKGVIISPERAQELMKSGFHVKQPWDDIGYHFGVEQVGSGYEALIGRMPYNKGAHCYIDNMNSRALGICVVGNYDNISPGIVHWEKILDVCEFVARTYNIIPVNFHGHREHDSRKTCPGIRFDMDRLRYDLQKRLDF